MYSYILNYINDKNFWYSKIKYIHIYYSIGKPIT